MNSEIVEDACRVCLKQKSKDLTKSIFEKCDDDNSLLIADKIMMLSGVKISKEQNLAYKICKKCLNLLDVSYNFRKQCRRSDNILQFVLNKKNRNNIIVSLDNGKTYTLPQDIKLKVIKSDKKEIQEERIIQPLTFQNETEKYETNTEDSFYTEYLDETPIYELDVQPIEISYNEEQKDTQEIIKTKSHLRKSIKKITNKSVKVTSIRATKKNKVQDKLNELIIEAIDNEGNENDDNKNDDNKNDDNDDDDNENHDSGENDDEMIKGGDTNDGDDEEDGEYIVRLKVKRENEKAKYICELCGNSYKQRCQLTIHMKRHRNEKTYPCEICGQLFLTNSLMARHLKRHTGIKPYKCNYCTRRFYEKGSCRAHEKTHSGARPYECKICGKTFIYSQGLTKHMLIHDEIKLYSCTYCHKEFRLKHHLTQHIATQLHQETVQKALSATE